MGRQVELALVTRPAKDRKPRRRAAGRPFAPIEIKGEMIGLRSITYERRHVLCGKPRCRKLHGPYWYAFWKQGGRVRTAYIGREWVSLAKKAPHKLAQSGEKP